MQNDVNVTRKHIRKKWQAGKTTNREKSFVASVVFVQLRGSVIISLFKVLDEMMVRRKSFLHRGVERQFEGHCTDTVHQHPGWLSPSHSACCHGYIHCGWGGCRWRFGDYDDDDDDDDGVSCRSVCPGASVFPSGPPPSARALCHLPWGDTRQVREARNRN